MGRQPDLSAEIIAVGTELLSFGRTETNSLRIAHRLIGLGFSVRRKVVVGDCARSIGEALTQALAGADVVIVTGGLGPTADDLTREAVAGTLGLSLHPDEEIVQALFERFEKAGIELSDNNRRQAEVPDGAAVLANRMGTAPGLLLDSGSARVFLLPGPPRELEPMLDEQVVPLLQSACGARPRPQRVVKIVGLAESRLDAAIQPICSDYPEVETTVLSSVGILSLYFVWRGVSADEGESRLDDLLGRLRARLKRRIFAESEEGLVDVVGRQLRERKLQLAVAESCTGGLVGKLLTDVAGSSSFFVGGVVSYSDRLKQSLLDVRLPTLRSAGAVSAETAAEMACGVRLRTGADIGLAVTGVAGPDGGSDEKPVGLVFVAVSDRRGGSERRLQLPGARDLVRRRAAWLAIDLVRRRLER